MSFQPRCASLLFFALCIAFTGCQSAEIREFYKRYHELENLAKQTGEEYSQTLFEGPLATPAFEMIEKYGIVAIDEAARRLDNSREVSPLTELIILEKACYDHVLSPDDEWYAKSKCQRLQETLKRMLNNHRNWHNSAHLALMLLHLFPRKETVPLVRRVIQETNGAEDYHLLCLGIGYLSRLWSFFSDHEKKAIREELEKKGEKTSHEFSRSAIEQYLDQLK